MKIYVKLKKLDERAMIPTCGSEYSAGNDLYALCEGDLVIKSGETKLIHTGIAIEIPEGTVGLICARSGIATKRGLAPANKIGVIDSDYRGELMVSLHNHSNNDQTVSNGERIAQILFVPSYSAEFEEHDELSDTERADGGFGSTGKM